MSTFSVFQRSSKWLWDVPFTYTFLEFRKVSFSIWTLSSERLHFFWCFCYAGKSSPGIRTPHLSHKIRLVSAQLSEEHLWLHTICYYCINQMRGLYMVFNLRDACSAVVIKNKNVVLLSSWCTWLFCCSICKAQTRKIILWSLELWSLYLCYLCTSEHFFLWNIWIYFKNKIIWFGAGSSPPQRPSGRTGLYHFLLKYRRSYLRCKKFPLSFFCLVRHKPGERIMDWWYLILCSSLSVLGLS